MCVIGTLVTIAIPIYNAKEYLSYAVQSCINQTFQDWELLLMEDGSTDGSDLMAREFAAMDARIRVISDGVNRGLVYRLNESIGLAKGKYYARMDADDIMAVNRIEEEFRYLEAHPDVDVVGTSIMTIDNENHIVGSGYMEGKVNGFIHPTVMGRTCWYQKNLYEEWALRAEDFELWTRSGHKSQFRAIGKPLLFYREFGVPSFHKTYLSLRTLLRIFLRYKQYGKPLSWCVSNMVLTCMKIAVYAVFNSVGCMDYIVGKRQRKEVPTDRCLSADDLSLAVS